MLAFFNSFKTSIEITYTVDSSFSYYIQKLDQKEIKDKNKDEVIYEAADLVYHSLVGLSFSGISPDLIKSEIKRRFGVSGIVEKNSRGE